MRTTTKLGLGQQIQVGHNSILSGSGHWDVDYIPFLTKSLLPLPLEHQYLFDRVIILNKRRESHDLLKWPLTVPLNHSSSIVSKFGRAHDNRNWGCLGGRREGESGGRQFKVWFVFKATRAVNLEFCTKFRHSLFKEIRFKYTCLRINI